ncbi:pyridoxamine 5'-phosphate oxidase family protein [Rossellomorea sp. DA94]|uniref:pyridoxamine 5'-phosphate oxidase family protein n=1 Tax=Rossellomorea sp. DA94 TaxID=3038653 RepID=UPI0024476D04|nr:pyridoxamine 5'-phosphate oxidase family protein [Rossellomorea sp. DA94]WGG46042.1 pyridoxamine 5'-phosphate oxidase family protein [Rossellomorea sp. DA94]
MSQAELKQQILKVLDESKVGTLATVKNNKPHSRYMTFSHDELTLYTPTSNETHKTDEIEDNPNVHILLGYEGDGYGDTFVEIEGRASVEDSARYKEKLWNDHMKRWFEGPDDPNYIVLKIQPTAIRLMNDEEDSPQSLEL